MKFLPAKFFLLILSCFVAQQSSSQSENEARRSGIKSSTTIISNADSDPKKRTTSRVFDKKGRELEVCEQFSSQKECYRSEYSRKGLLTKEHFFVNDSLQFSLHYSYSGSGRPLKKIRVGHAGDSVLVEETHWNAWGDKSEELQFDKTGQLKKKITYLYNKRGLLISRKTEDGNGRLIQEKSVDYEFH